MRYIKSLIPAALLAIGFLASSCDNEKMEWYKDPNKGDVTVNEIPLKYSEKLALYKSLKEYNKENVILGVGMGVAEYMDNETYRTFVNENFEAVTAGYHMKHGPMVSSNGTLNFTRVDNFLNMLPASIAVYGHTLGWHQNQNGDYLRGLIAPTIIPGASGTNILSNGDFENDLTGWNSWGSGKQSVEISTEKKLSGDKAVKAATKAASTNLWDLQIQSPSVATISGHRYEISFYIKSEGEGEMRVNFAGMSNQYPSVNGGGSTTKTSSTWTRVAYSGDSFKATGTSMSFQFDLGKVGDMVYYIDFVRVVDLDAGNEPVNVVPNGSFENDWGNWVRQNQGAGMSVTTDEKMDGTHSAKIIAKSGSASAWDLQLITPSLAVTATHTYELSFYVKSDVAGRGRISFPGQSNEYPYMSWTGGSATEYFSTTTAWQQIKCDVKADNNSFKLSFDFGYLPDVTYYIDDVKLVDKASGSSGSTEPIIIEKTAEEKAEIIDAALKNWISSMVGHYKERVHDWDVVNEPVGDNGEIRVGDGKGDSGDIFHWQDFLGKDYAVKAFKYAREAGADGVLFINEYAIESNTTKLDGFLKYVEYIESQGVKIDGLGTQMHVRVGYTTNEGIDNMFKKLAATGKKIKVSELDVQVGTATPSAEQMTAQSDMFQYVIESYMKNVPASQRYGITIWGVTDETSWIENDAPCIWNAKDARKPAYKGVADGLFGEDASANWTYEDIVNAAKE